ncbi:unnamed protein product [Oppiella nova]|uniref:Uncharacterized protein n=1 Tax=Oppiella nova TaxID=334625 RepID=A0A7R9MFB4_9ACAR|nr:unnamed protein product [Oppiella nova]CAG2176331.1 unnamed protein product [Oppiella nova]
MSTDFQILGIIMSISDEGIDFKTPSPGRSVKESELALFPNFVVLNGSERSIDECKRLISNAEARRPYNIRDTLSLNNAKQNILLLTQPLADIAKNIADNQIQCEQRRKCIAECEDDLDKLKPELFMPHIEIVEKELEHIKRVCRHEECCKNELVNGIVVVQYKTDCQFVESKRKKGHKFNLGGKVETDAKSEQGWSVALKNALLGPLKSLLSLNYEYYDDNSTMECVTCAHSKQQHLSVSHEKSLIHKQLRDEVILQRLTSTQNMVEAKETQLRELKAKIEELAQESEIIVKCMAKFACIISLNALQTSMDHFQHYVAHLIDQNTTNWAEDSSQILDAMKSVNINEFKITVDEINDMIDGLGELKWTGSTIKLLKCTNTMH